MIVDRILKIIELEKLNKAQFYKITGLSNGFLDKVKDVGASKLESILNSFPHINPEWLLTGKGEMLRDAVSKQEVKPDCTEVVKDKNRIIELLELDNKRLKSELDQIKSDKESADKTRKNVH